MKVRESIKKRVTFKDATGALADPVSVVCKVKQKSNGALSTYTYGTDAALTKVGTGVYQISVQATASGTWNGTFEGTNSAGEVVVAHFEVAVEPDTFYG